MKKCTGPKKLIQIIWPEALFPQKKGVQDIQQGLVVPPTSTGLVDH